MVKNLTGHRMITPTGSIDIDEKNRKLEKNRHEPVRTGYQSKCIIYNTRKRKEILFRKDFIERKMPKGVFLTFFDMKHKRIMIQPVPLYYINRTSIAHVIQRRLPFLLRYKYKAVLDMTPEPQTILHKSGVDPRMRKYSFIMTEYRIRDDDQGGIDVMAYALEPLKPLL